MHRIHFTTFLKLLSQTTQEKARSYRRYDEPGGYDFYQSFKRGAEGITTKGETLERASGAIEALSNLVEREHNRSALASLATWLGARNTFFDPPRGFYRSPSKTLTVVLKPEICRSHKERRQVIAAWNTKDVALTPTVAGVGIYMLRTKLARGEYVDCSFHVLDLVRGKLYGPASIPNHVESLLGAEFAVADQLLGQDEAA